MARKPALRTPDDPRADKPVRYILTGLASFAMLLGFIALLLAPLAFAFSLFRRGATATAIGLAGLYFVGCGYLLTRLFSKR